VREFAVAAALALCAGLAAAVGAQEARVTLSVKPVLCITDAREDSCALSILVAWRSSRPGSYCLYNDLSNDPLRCWQVAEGGMVVEERVVEDTVHYWLTAGASTVRVAEASLDVVSASSDDRRRNRQRRHVWDIL
jgi:hypothetical protein